MCDSLLSEWINQSQQQQLKRAKMELIPVFRTFTAAGWWKGNQE